MSSTGQRITGTRIVGRYPQKIQMSWGDVAFDTDLAAKVLWDLVGAPALDGSDVDVRKSCDAH